jgi:uncharacterized protein YecE (DUF72 family)
VNQDWISAAPATTAGARRCVPRPSHKERHEAALSNPTATEIGVAGRKSVKPRHSMPGQIYIGTAGWSIPRVSAYHCPPGSTDLERYARLFTCAEINSSFYRSHEAATYAKWAASTPDDFRFAIKMPRLITHEHKLRRSRAPFERFLADATGLGRHRGPLLLQLPPSFAFEPRAAARFFEMMRNRDEGPVSASPGIRRGSVRVRNR